MDFGDLFKSFNPLAAAVGVGTDVFNAIWQSGQNDKMIEAQQAENQKNRDFNKQMAEQANLWNIQQWQRQNDYDLPINQIMRMKQAGLNPDLMYSGGGNATGLPGFSSSGASSSGGISPVSPAQLSLQNTLAVERQRAEIDNIKADTDKTKAEGSIAWSDAKVRDALNSGVLESQGVTIDLTRSQKNVSDYQARTLARGLDKMDAEIDNLRTAGEEARARIANLEQDEIFKKLQNLYSSRQFELTCQEIASRTALNYAQARAVAMNATTAQALANSQISLNDANAAHVYKLDAENGMTETQLAISKATLVQEEAKAETARITCPEDTPATRLVGMIGWTCGQIGQLLGGLK